MKTRHARRTGDAPLVTRGRGYKEVFADFTGYRQRRIVGLMLTGLPHLPLAPRLGGAILLNFARRKVLTGLGAVLPLAVV
jgi:hypothetical protein